MSKKTTSCPCGSGHTFQDCCGRYIEGEHLAPTPEALMRSRYSAYALGNEPYLLATWHASTRPEKLNLDEQTTIKWSGLDIISAPGAEGDTGFVEFVARFKDNGRAGKLHERSRFRRENDRWYYVDGDIE